MVEAKLENLIEKIKLEGVQEAKKQSDEIIAKAKEEASSIVITAKNEAEKIVENAKIESEKFRKNAESAIQQGARDVVLVLKEKIRDLFDRVFKMQISDVLSQEFLKDNIVKIIENWSQKQDLEILVSTEDQKNLMNLVFSAIRDELKDSLLLKADNRIHKGFRIGVKGEDVFYDLTDDGILEFLKQYVSTGVSEILN